MMHVQAQRKAGKGAAEVITGLDRIVEKFMRAFREFTKVPPQKIIYFRDGVGDGQFQEVRSTLIHFLVLFISRLELLF